MPARRRLKDVGSAERFDERTAIRLLSQIDDLEEKLRSSQSSLRRLIEERRESERKVTELRRANSRLEAEKRHLEIEVDKYKHPMRGSRD